MTNTMVQAVLGEYTPMLDMKKLESYAYFFLNKGEIIFFNVSNAGLNLKS